MKAVLLIIGDEILNGTTLDSNSQFISRALEGLNIRVVRRITIKDLKEEIISGLDQALSLADIVLTTGGLGPTKDDITKKTICEYLQDELVLNEAVLEHVENYFTSRGREVLEVNRMQALVPSRAFVIPNRLGTAPGMWMEKNEKVIVSMPGVPYEMKYIMTHGVLPQLKSRMNDEEVVNRHIHTIGVGESKIARQLGGVEERLPEHIRLAYLPSPGIVKLRLTGISKKGRSLYEEVSQYENEIKDTLGDIVFGSGDDTISSKVGEILRDRKESLATFESCTSGYLSQLITQSPGSSNYYEGSLITYSYGLKEKLLGVKHETLLEHGAVSKATILEMLHGGLERLPATYGIATSGIAGPGGGLPNKPVGTVWIAVGSREKQCAKKFHFGGDRTRNIHLSAVMGLEMLRRMLLGLTIQDSTD